MSVTPLPELVGQSQVFVDEMRKIARLAKCEAGVLIRGETGTGKELVARAIHQLSSRWDRPFVAANCGAIPVDLVENELFGHDRGAFTGATNSRPGLIHETKSGTLFLDEIDSLPLLAQVKLLRFIQEKEYRPIGVAKASKADVRIIAATNTNLEEAMETDRFRRDLYYRLNVIPIVLPPLRDRRGDIRLLAEHFCQKYCAELQRPPVSLSPEASYKLEFHSWPGNVRELENVVLRSIILCEGDTIEGAGVLLPDQEDLPHTTSFRELKARVVSDFERSYIERLLTIHQGNITKAAQAACKERRTFWALLRKHKIRAERFRLGLSNIRQG
jgi:DNA-binding NtrC family response regulator